MSPLYAGVGGVVRELIEMYTGVGGVVKSMTEMWTGIGGVNKQIFSAGPDLVNIQIRLRYDVESWLDGMTVSYIDENGQIQNELVTSSTNPVQFSTPKNGLIAVSGSGLALALTVSIYDFITEKVYLAYNKKEPLNTNPRINCIVSVAIPVTGDMDLSINA